MTTDMWLAIAGGFCLGWVARAVIKAMVIVGRSSSARAKYFRELESDTTRMAELSAAVRNTALLIVGVRALLVPGLVLAVLAMWTS